MRTKSDCFPPRRVIFPHNLHPSPRCTPISYFSPDQDLYHDGHTLAKNDFVSLPPFLISPLGTLTSKLRSKCADPNSTSCSSIDPRPLGDMCCGSSTACISLDGGSFAICRPDNIDCSAIQPISCLVDLQDLSRYPDVPIKTTLLNGALDSYEDDRCCLLNIDESKGFHQKGTAASVPTSSPHATTTALSSIPPLANANALSTSTKLGLAIGIIVVVVFVTVPTIAVLVFRRQEENSS